MMAAQLPAPLQPRTTAAHSNIGTFTRQIAAKAITPSAIPTRKASSAPQASFLLLLLLECGALVVEEAAIALIDDVLEAAATRHLRGTAHAAVCLHGEQRWLSITPGVRGASSCMLGGWACTAVMLTLAPLENPRARCHS